MKVFDRLIKVSKSSWLEKRFDVDLKKLSRAERKKIEPFLPTEDEQDFAKIFVSRAPELARLQRKMSVCLLVEVSVLEEDRVEFIYGKDSYTLTAPTDSWKICQALDRSSLEGLQEMAVQGCALKNGKAVASIKNGPLGIDEIRLLSEIAERFFFQIFMA